MAKNSIREYSVTAASNTDIGGIGVQGTNAVSNFDGAFRELMAQIADMNQGVDPIDDTMKWCDPADATKIFRFDAGSIPAGTARVITIPNATGTMAILGLAQTFTATQTFPSVTVSGSAPTITFLDTDTGADSTISANSATGSVSISADSNNEIANSIVTFSVDGTQRGTFDSTGAFNCFGTINLSSSAPVMTFTDTDTGADSTVSASSSVGGLALSADVNNESANSIIGFSVDGTLRATIDSTGALNVASYSDTGASVGMKYDTAAGIFRTSQNASTVKFHHAYYNTNGNVGGITTTGTATAYNTSSDYRRKPVVEDLSGFWERLNAVKPRKYQWDNGQWDTGFIAHEFAVPYPQSVTGQKDEVDADGRPVYQTMQASTSQVIADIIAALQDINTRLANVEA